MLCAMAVALGRVSERVGVAGADCRWRGSCLSERTAKANQAVSAANRAGWGEGVGGAADTMMKVPCGGGGADCGAEIASHTAGPTHDDDDGHDGMAAMLMGRTAQRRRRRRSR